MEALGRTGHFERLPADAIRNQSDSHLGAEQTALE
jgi:hypothetical protein